MFFRRNTMFTVYNIAQAFGGKKKNKLDTVLEVL